MKKIKALFVVFIAALLLLSACDDGTDSTLSYLRKQNREKEAYLNTLNDISTQFMSANFMVVITNSSWGSSTAIQGSGVLYKKQSEFGRYRYFLLTNHHVTSNATQKSVCEVIDYKDNKITAKVDYQDKNFDLGIMSFTSKEEYYVPEFAAENPKVGDGVFAIGQPLGQRNTVTFGYVQFYRKQEFDWADIDFKCLFHSAYIQSGNSGGVLLDKNLKIAGINFAAGIFQTPEASKEPESTDPENQISISVPVLNVKEFITQFEALKSAA